MSENHPKRSRVRNRQANTPEPGEVRTIRLSLGLSRPQAAAMVHATTHGWEDWEDGDRPMHPATWELFRLKVRALMTQERIEALIDKVSPPRPFVRILADGTLLLCAPNGKQAASMPMPEDFKVAIRAMR